MKLFNFLKRDLRKHTEENEVYEQLMNEADTFEQSEALTKLHVKNLQGGIAKQKKMIEILKTKK